MTKITTGQLDAAPNDTGIALRVEIELDDSVKDSWEHKCNGGNQVFPTVRVLYSCCYLLWTKNWMDSFIRYPLYSLIRFYCVNTSCSWLCWQLMSFLKYILLTKYIEKWIKGERKKIQFSFVGTLYLLIAVY